MAAQKSSALNINILKRQDIPKQAYVNLLSWILNTGKFILIVVEIIVIGAFLARFTLQQQLESVKEQINSQLPYLKSLQPEELAIRKMQFKLSNIKQTKAQTLDYSVIANAIAQAIPTDITLTDLLIDRTKSFPNITVSISGKSPSSLDMAAFAKALQNNPMFTQVSIQNISKQAGIVKFTIAATVKPDLGENNGSNK